MGIFGWSLPPGCGTLPGEEDEIPCAICGLWDDKCECPECPTCGDIGDPRCWTGDKKHAEWPNRGDEVKCLLDFLTQRGVENAWQAGRSLYKYVGCGPWTTYPVDWGHSEKTTVYYEDKEASEYITHCTGVHVGSIVEGSDVYVDGYEMLFPFTMTDFWKNVDEIDKEASFYWERDNSHWFVLISPKGNDYYGHETWGEIKWDGRKPPRHKELERAIFEHMNAAFEEGGDQDPFPCYGDGVEQKPIPRKGWGVRGVMNDTTY